MIGSDDLEKNLNIDMKSIVTLIISLSLLIPASGQSKWEILNEGSFLYFRDFEMTNADTAWIIDAGKGLFKTNDGGNTWLTVLETEPFYFYGIEFVNDITGWLLKLKVEGDSSSLQIHKTLDGGQTWFHQKSVNRVWFSFANRIYAVNDSIVYVLADSLLKTTDGGTSWVDVTPPGGYDFSKGSFLNADTGIVIGRNDKGVTSLFRTFNGGKDWLGKTNEFRDIYDITFLNDSTGYFRADEYPGNYRLYKTTDSFNSWVAITDEKNFIYGYHFFDEDLGISIMGDNTGTNLMKSEDGGLSWENTRDLKLPGWGWTYQFYFFENVGYLICYGFNGGSLILKTVNNGTIWKCTGSQLPI